MHRVRRVLLVENDPAVVEMMNIYLGYAGYEAITAVSVEDAIRIIDEDVINRGSGGILLEEEMIEVAGEDDENNDLPKQFKVIDAILLDGSLHQELDSLQVLDRVKHHRLPAPVIAISGNPVSNRILCEQGAKASFVKTQTMAIVGYLATL
ncbi:hypothetical protein HN858_04480 [Candidatus Falkowbacteria bacterium]|jgi:DNA-binding response OmpR family regulator|nr:hypothetical protein [Candidatus Falkowbacteria bacterium]MBT5503842.1 hypothetical protein [Candidatus Falkowbacteria bacterium]MBT6574385.1 hypothetical protein [Candidatus Falkowbacteria bacterium]MBT7348901.1 hypothetical protein [Candidatus Falkowbacteria bacterium]MBT7501258.1 hypothetical protein [Candidatus Falkowbacteria bacterium]